MIMFNFYLLLYCFDYFLILCIHLLIYFLFVVEDESGINEFLDNIILKKSSMDYILLL